MGNINEIGDTPKGQYALGQVAARAEKRLNDIHKNTPKKEHMTAAEAYPKDATKFRNTMDDAKAEAFYPPYQKLRKHFSQGYNDYKNKKTNESIIKLTEQDLHAIVKNTIQNILKEDYAGNYDELIKDEMHRLYQLELKVPQHIKPEIHNMVITMESILQNIQMNNTLNNI